MLAPRDTVFFRFKAVRRRQPSSHFWTWETILYRFAVMNPVLRLNGRLSNLYDVVYLQLVKGALVAHHLLGNRTKGREYRRILGDQLQERQSHTFSHRNASSLETSLCVLSAKPDLSKRRKRSCTSSSHRCVCSFRNEEMVSLSVRCECELCTRSTWHLAINFRD